MSKIYFVGPPGAGKTSRMVARLVEFISDNARPDRLLVLVPQQAQAQAFRNALAQMRGKTRARGEPDISTLYGLAQRHVGLFFPLIAERAGFLHPRREPVMMNVESAQYFLNQIVEPRIADFDDLKLYRPRLLGQILDSMNKAAECGFGLDEIAARLGAAWSGEPRRLVSYQRAQEVALAFRRYCLDHSLLDFSLQMETFSRYLLAAPEYRRYIAGRYQIVLADNVEENPPVMHDFLAQLLPTCESAMLAEDEPGGYRLYLGADVASARTLRAYCDEVVELSQCYTAPPEVIAFGQALMAQLSRPPTAISHAIETASPSTQDPPLSTLHSPHSAPPSTLHPPQSAPVAIRDALGDTPGSTKYWTGMVSWVVDRIVALVGSGVEPRDIAVLAPYVEDVLRFELQERLHLSEIRVHSVRPSRPLYDHPVTRMLVALAKLAHPEWGQFVPVADLARALTVCIGDLDVARAQLIADAASRTSPHELARLEDQALWQRVGMRFYERYAILQAWLATNKSRVPEQEPPREAGNPASMVIRQASVPLDLFWQQLFSDVLSQPGFELDREEALVCDKLIRAARAFREVFERARLSPQDLPSHDLATSAASTASAATASADSPELDIGLQYINSLGDDIIAAQYAPEREPDESDDNAVLLAPAYTYLVSNFRSRYQFWLDINSLGWYERVYQPLTHPYVLSRRWQPGRPWTEEDEHRERFVMLAKVAGGLAYRCSGKIYLASSQLSIGGQEESGPLVKAIQRILKQGAAVYLP